MNLYSEIKISILLVAIWAAPACAQYTITTVAGNGSPGFSGDGGPATTASLYLPTGVAVDGAGNLYIVDSNNNRIRKVTAGGAISTFAGNGSYRYSGDGGPAASASLNNPQGVAVDGAGNLYIADTTNSVIRKVTTDGMISTVAGNGSLGYSGDGGPATSASLNFPQGVAVDGAGNLYIADTDNSLIRKVTPGGIIWTAAGNGNAGYSGDGGAATSASLYFPTAVAVDSAGNLYVVDNNNNRIRKVTAGGIIYTYAGNGSYGYSGDGGAAGNASLNGPYGVAVDGAGTLYIPDFGNQRIRKVIADGTISTIAGNGRQGYSGDGGPATSASLDWPRGIAVDAAGNLYVADSYNQRIRKLAPPGAVTALRFVPVTPCRVADTRNTTRLAANETRTFTPPSSGCGIPSTAAAYSLNVTVVPAGPLGYLSLWPTGQARPMVSTLNSFDGRIKANAASVPAGTGGGVNVYVTDATDVVLDINGYFVPAATPSSLAFYPVTPCRVADTRNLNGPFGGPSLAANSSRSFTVPQSGCGIPAAAQAYSLNFTVVPRGPLGYLTTWPTGSGQPWVSTLNAPTGTVVANAAIVPAGTSGAVSVYASDSTTDVILDINGYFAAPGTGGLSFYAANPCRISDTRNAAGTFGGPTLGAREARTYPVPASACQIPAAAAAYSLNATVVPQGMLGYLTLWPAGGTRPLASTLNSFDGTVVANAAIVPAGTSGGIMAYVTDMTDLILDINGYFAP